MANYQPIAQEVRRYFYLLASISVVGAVDHVITLFDYYSRNNPFMQTLSTEMIQSMEDYQKVTIIYSIAVLVLYSVCFIVTMLMSSFDVQVFVKFGQHVSTDAWVTVALADSKFRCDE